MTQRQETEAKQRLIEATTLLIEALNLIRDGFVPNAVESRMRIDFDKATKLENKIRKFLKVPT